MRNGSSVSFFHAVAPVGTEWEVDGLALGQLPLTFLCAQRRPAAEHDQELFPGVMEVVDDEVAGVELVEGGAEAGTLERAREPLGAAASARPVLVLLAPLVVPDVHGGTVTDKEAIFCHL